MNTENTINVNGKEFAVNNQHFVLVTNPNASFEDYGWTREEVEYLLFTAEYSSADLQEDNIAYNSLGIIFTEAVGVDLDMEKGI